jgi:hypothetical protein
LRCVQGRNINALFFLLGWDQYGFHIKRVGTPYAELVFLHRAVSVGHIVHSGASGAQMLTHYFSCLGGTGAVSIKARWDWLCRICVSASGGICGSHRALLCVRGTPTHYFSCSAGTGTDSTKKVWRDTLRRTCVSASGGICGSRSALWCLRGVKH